MIILDFGSGNTCRNDYNYVRRMITELARLESTQDIVIKWQLFQSATPNQRLSWHVFERAYTYANLLGYQTTASVFDVPSLDFIQSFDVPFVKIANQPASKAIKGFVKLPIVESIGDPGDTIITTENENSVLFCVSEYPADKQLYIDKFGDLLQYGISDHTEDFELYKTYKPKTYECHYKLEDSKGLDAGTFARTPEQLKEILLPTVEEVG